MPRGSSFDSKMGGKRAENPARTLLRLMKYYKSCKAQMIVAVIGILLYSAATTLTYYMLDPLVSVLEKGVNAECDTMGRGLKAQMKLSDKLAAKFTVVLGETELQEGVAKVKRMSDGTEEEVSLSALADYINEKKKG